MTFDSFRDCCLRKKGVTEEFPFGEETAVYKVMGKMFALTDVVDFAGINLKVDPEKGIELREQYDAVQPGYHMNKKHWITVRMDGSIADKLIQGWIEDSYQLVVSKLTRRDRDALAQLPQT